MNPYATGFLLFLYQLSFGGLFALSVTPFFDLERGFYKSTTAVLVLAAVLALWGQIDLLSGNEVGVLGYISLVLLGAFTLFIMCYFILLWGERGFLRARCYAAALLTGFAGLIVSSLLFQSLHAILEIALLSISAILSAFLLGSVTVGMLIGHWYLIDTGQSLEPFYRVFKFFVAILIIQSAFQWMTVALLYAFGAPTTVAALERIFLHHSILLASRALVAQVAPLAISYMIWKTLKEYRNTMAATGLFYIALLGVFVGALVSLQVFALTLLPI